MKEEFSEIMDAAFTARTLAKPTGTSLWDNPVELCEQDRSQARLWLSPR
jgi:hypothetical protein